MYTSEKCKKYPPSINFTLFLVLMSILYYLFQVLRIEKEPESNGFNESNQQLPSA